MKTLGIDIGTTTISAVVLDAKEQQVLTSRTIANDSFITTENDWERIQDVSRIIFKSKVLLDELLDQNNDIEAIGITCQMHGILYLDASGNCLSPLYTWQDGRGNQLMELSDSAEEQETYASWASRLTGKQAASGYGLITHLYHVKKYFVPENADKICTIGDYLGMVLTGRKEPLTHTTNAASFGFFDVAEGCFDVKALKKIGIDPLILPAVTGEFRELGNYCGLPVTAAIGDNQASFLGSAGLQDQVLLVNMGTGGQISVLSDVFFEVPGIEARPFVKGKYLLAGSSLCGGRAYAILEKFLHRYVEAVDGKADVQYEVMEKLAAEEWKRRTEKEHSRRNRAGAWADPMQITTTFNGTRVNPLLRGSICNISEDNFTPEGMVYGVLDGMAQELYDMFLLIQKGIGLEAKKLVASGNGLRKNAVLREIFSMKFQADLTLALYEEEAACGAAVSALLRE